MDTDYVGNSSEKGVMGWGGGDLPRTMNTVPPVPINCSRTKVTPKVRLMSSPRRLVNFCIANLVEELMYELESGHPASFSNKI